MADERIKEEGLTDAYLLGKYEGEKEGYNKAIDEFAKKIREYSGEHYIDCDGTYGYKKDLAFMTDVFLDDIVESLKEQK